MPENEIVSNGWDLIAAASQSALNTQLAKIKPVSIKKQVPVPLFNQTVNVDVDLVFKGPELRVRDGSGQMVDILLPVAGHIKTSGLMKVDIKIPEGEKFTVTTELTQIENELVPHPDKTQTNFDLMIDFKSEKAIVDMKLGIPVTELAFLIDVLKQVIQRELHGGKQYKVASFALSNDKAESYRPLIPHVADFTFVSNTKNPGRSNLLVLMQSVSKGKPDGGVVFKKPLLAPDQDFMVLVSNKLFLERFVEPPLIEKLKTQAKNADDVPKKMSIKQVGNSQSDMWQLYNKSDINIKQDHDPWIHTITAEIDATKQAIYFNLLVQADVTFLNIRGEMWDKSWQQFQVDKEKQTVALKQIKEEKGKSTKMEWWKWALACLNWIALLVTGIIYAIVEDKMVDLGGTFLNTATVIVQWPNQKYVHLKHMTTPSHIVLDLDVSFSG